MRFDLGAAVSGFLLLSMRCYILSKTSSVGFVSGFSWQNWAACCDEKYFSIKGGISFF